MLNGLNHLTLAVSELARSTDFYQTLLGFKLHASWAQGAYLSSGDLWLCLSLDDKRNAEPAADYTHYAFSISEDNFTAFSEHLRKRAVAIWKDNKSEGNSFYFLDPDGHKLEIHVGTLQTRLQQCRRRPYEDMQFFD